VADDLCQPTEYANIRQKQPTLLAVLLDD